MDKNSVWISLKPRLSVLARSAATRQSSHAERTKLCRRVMLACILLLVFCMMPAISAFSQNESLPENIERNPAELQPAPAPQPVKPKPRPAYIPDASEWKHDDDETLTPSDLDKGHETFLLAP